MQAMRRALTLFAVDTNADGLSRDNVRLVDSAVAAHVEFDGVTVDADAVIGEVDEGDAVLRRMLNAGRIGSAAETVGVGAGSMDITVEYVKGRKQFDKYHRIIPGIAAPAGASLQRDGSGAGNCFESPTDA